MGTMGRSASAIVVALVQASALLAAPPGAFLKDHCFACHNAEAKKGGLDLTRLQFPPNDAEQLGRWVTIHDRIAAAEMPPATRPRPAAADRAAFVKSLHD